MIRLKLFELSLKAELRKIVMNIPEVVHEQIVAAFNKEHARELAQNASSKECTYSKKEFNTDEPWLDKNLTKCQQITFVEDNLGGVISQETFR